MRRETKRMDGPGDETEEAMEVAEILSPEELALLKRTLQHFLRKPDYATGTESGLTFDKLEHGQPLPLEIVIRDWSTALNGGGSRQTQNGGDCYEIYTKLYESGLMAEVDLSKLLTGGPTRRIALSEVAIGRYTLRGWFVDDGHDRIEHVVDVLDGEESLFRERTILTGTAVAMEFGDRTSEDARAWVEQRTLAKATTRLAVQLYEAGETCSETISSLTQREQPGPKTDAGVKHALLGALSRLRRADPIDYAKRRLDLDSLALVLDVQRTQLEFVASTLLEQGLISTPGNDPLGIRTGHLHITARGIRAVDNADPSSDRNVVGPAPPAETSGGALPPRWDAFISHASEDKDVVRIIAEELRRLGLRVWYDEFTLRLGDSLRRSIDDGLANSRYGIVFLSKNFFSKEWPKRELDGLVAREILEGNVILPVWHDVSREDIAKFSPPLADRIAVSTSENLQTVALKIFQVVRGPETHKRLANILRREMPEEPIRIETISPLDADVTPKRVEQQRATTHYNRAVDLMKAEDFENARTHLLKAIQLDPTIPEAHCNLANIYLREHNLRDAQESLGTALELEPNLHQAYLVFADLFREKKQPDKATEALQKAKSVAPIDDAVFAGIARRHLVLGNLDEAIACYRRAVEIDPDSAANHYNLGNCLARKHDMDGAITAFKRAIELDEGFVMAWNNLGHTLCHAGRHEEAQEVLDIAKRKEPESFHPWYSAAQNYYKWGRLDAAERDYRRVTEMAPEFPGGWEGLGEVYELLGEEQEAIMCFEKMAHVTS